MIRRWIHDELVSFTRAHELPLSVVASVAICALILILLFGKGKERPR